MIEAFISDVPVVTVLIGLVTGTLVLTVVIGSMLMLRRNRRDAPAPAQPEPQPAAAAAHAAAAIAAAYGTADAAQGDSDQEAWEMELAERLDDLETAFASLTGKLGQMQGMDNDGAEVLRSLRAREARGARSRKETARGFGRSEEQEQLLRRLSERTGSSGNAVGA